MHSFVKVLARKLCTACTFCCSHSMIRLQNSQNFLNKQEAKPKPIVVHFDLLPVVTHFTDFPALHCICFKFRLVDYHVSICYDWDWQVFYITLFLVL